MPTESSDDVNISSLSIAELYFFILNRFPKFERLANRLRNIQIQGNHLNRLDCDDLNDIGVSSEEFLFLRTLMTNNPNLAVITHGTKLKL